MSISFMLLLYPKISHNINDIDMDLTSAIKHCYNFYNKGHNLELNSINFS